MCCVSLTLADDSVGDITYSEDYLKTSKVNVTTRDANQGERMIEVKVRFWTNEIATGKGVVRPKHAWSSGVVRIERNKTHDIVPGSPKPFHSLMDLPAVMEKVLIQHGVVLHLNRQMKKYFDVK